jgi:hypothetical protein
MAGSAGQRLDINPCFVKVNCIGLARLCGDFCEVRVPLIRVSGCGENDRTYEKTSADRNCSNVAARYN